jgi:glycine cleavage system H protein
MKYGDYEYPDDLFYDRYDGWVRREGDMLVMGVTDMFQKMAGEIIFVEVPAVGRKLEEGQPFASIESGKWVGRLKAPVNGEIAEANAELADFPYLMNESPYGEGWVIKIRPADTGELARLMTVKDEAALKAFIAEEEAKVKKDNKGVD